MGRPAKVQQGVMPYGGYYRREVPPEDAEITHAAPGTPLGEYMRGCWQPVCMSSQLEDLPRAIRIKIPVCDDAKCRCKEICREVNRA